MRLGKLTVLDMTPLGWLGCKTSTQTNKQHYILEDSNYDPNFENILKETSSKKLEGHIASGMFVCVCVHVSVRLLVTLFDA